jgi:hypothetical protein
MDTAIAGFVFVLTLSLPFLSVIAGTYCLKRLSQPVPTPKE